MVALANEIDLKVPYSLHSRTLQLP
jgi:hypothetical protein